MRGGAGAQATKADPRHFETAKAIGLLRRGHRVRRLEFSWPTHVGNAWLRLIATMNPCRGGPQATRGLWFCNCRGERRRRSPCARWLRDVVVAESAVSAVQRAGVRP